MEYIDGTQVDRLDADALPQDERDALTQAFTRSLVKQLFIDGFFHGDLHPGNVMVDRATGELVLIDLGLVGRLNLRARLDLVELLVAIQQKDAGSLASLALRLTMHSRPVDAGKFRDDMGELVNQHIRYAEAQSFDSILGAFLALLQDHGMQLGEQFTIAVKTIAQSQEIVTALGGTVDFLPFVLRELAALALAEISLDRVVDLAGSHAISLAQELLRRIPGLDIVLPPQPDDVPPDRPQLSKGPDQLSLRLDRIQSTAANTGAGLVISLLTIGTAILTTAISQLVPVFLVLLVAGVMFAWRIPRPSSKR
ncbi:Phosphotransferase enzyme family protein [Tessaracoccus bendigoensis DSM 12906]|uniref:Phosphotransferase enzyme family protein n=1 Tax=Tessaracoccus bendigoensis DSM 12906 TaxID=1123357 RepID=A0A1M6CB67_9ACTN|nr:AarF/UbiB family protein [Tessaracoccus bendigoensis]SHI58262.1 Phosphotransferase enzyme family protein [Tessaracoccus bendigoensis DSM 12906]